MKFRPVDDNVLLLLDRCEEETLPSGIIKPATETSPIEARTAWVLASGPGVHHTYRVFPERSTQPTDASPWHAVGFMPNNTKPGMHVLMESRHSGQRVTVEQCLMLELDPERHYRIVRDCEVIAVLEPDAAQ